MTPDEREEMYILCQRLAEEKNHQKFLEYVRQLNELLQRQESRFQAHRSTAES